MAVIKQIENVSETAYRFSAILKFIPGAVTAVSEEDIKSHPVINTLIKNGKLKVVGAKNKAKKQEDVIEEA